jgi:hypothetical protein
MSIFQQRRKYISILLLLNIFIATFNNSVGLGEAENVHLQVTLTFEGNPGTADEATIHFTL